MGEDVKALHDLARRYWADLAETEYLPDDILEQIERTVPSHFPDVENLRAYLLDLEWGAGYHEIERMLTPKAVTNLTAMVTWPAPPTAWRALHTTMMPRRWPEGLPSYRLEGMSFS